MNIRKLFFSHQTDELTAAAEPEFVREDFTIANYEEKSIRDLLQILRDRTCDFALDNGLVSATTEFIYLTDLPIEVRLTEDYNVLYMVNRFVTSSVNEAVAVIEDAVQF